MKTKSMKCLSRNELDRCVTMETSKKLCIKNKDADLFCMCLIIEHFIKTWYFCSQHHDIMYTNNGYFIHYFSLDGNKSLKHSFLSKTRGEIQNVHSCLNTFSFLLPYIICDCKVSLISLDFTFPLLHSWANFLRVV